MTAEPGAPLLGPSSSRPTEVMKSSSPTNERGEWRSRTMTRPAERAISGAPPAPGRRTLGCVVVADDGGVDVAEAIDLRGAEEADVDAPAADPVVEHLGDRDEVLRAGGEVVVADRQRQALRARADRAGLVDEHAAGRVQAPREVGGGVRRPDPDEHDLAVEQLARGPDGHDLLGRRVDGAHRATTGAPTGASAARTFSSIHCVKRSRSREIASHSE